MKAIVAVDNNFGIGAGNELLFSIPADRKFFRENTSGKVVVMGRRTFLSLPDAMPLRDRINVVLTRDADFKASGAVIVLSLHELTEYLKRYSSDDIFVIGGGEVYAGLLPYCDTVLMTKIEAEKPADTFFPDIDGMGEWVLRGQSEKFTHNGVVFSFCRYEKG
jgi:dihydrofolate reductase